MAEAERESREQESATSLVGGLSSQEGRTNLHFPISPDALTTLGIAYHAAAVQVCDSALAAVGGRDRPAAADSRRVPSLPVEAQARPPPPTPP